MDRKPLVATVIEIETADSYRFQFQDSRCRWAIFTLNNATGELAIQSDAGQWAHRWSMHGFTEEERKSPKPLTMFLGKCGPEYVLDKLSYTQSKDLEQVFDEQATRKAIQGKILELRREGELPAIMARKAWTELKTWMQDHSFENDVERMRAYDDLSIDLTLKNLATTFHGYELWEFFQYKPSHIHDFLYHDLLPFFRDYLNKEVLK